MKVKKIIKVLRFLKNNCSNKHRCKKCSFYIDCNCVLENTLQNIPELWDIELIEKGIKDIERI